MVKSLMFTTAFFGLIFLLNSCKKDSGTGGGGGFNVDCNTIPNKAFTADVNPIFQSRCNTSGCHAAGSTNGPGPLTNYTQIANAKTSIRSAIIAGTMPKNSTLSTLQKNTIICWIDSGAPNN